LEQVIAMMKTNQEKMEATDLKGNPEGMECGSEHREVPKEDAVVKPVKGQKKRLKGRKLAAGRHGESKQLTQGDCGSRRKLAAACRKVSHRAAVAWRKRNVFRKIRTWGNWGSRCKFTVASRKMACRARVAWRRKNVVRKDRTRQQVERGTSKGREETVEGPRMQNWNKEPGHKTAATTQEGIQQDPQEDPRTGDQETSSWDFQRVVDNQGLGIVEGSPPSKAVEEPLACLAQEESETWESEREEEAEEKNLDDGENLN
jgi:hypothetical protein